MVKQHLKRLAVPRTWPIKRKGIKYITRPKPGAHPLSLGMPINVIFRDILGLTKTNKEVKKILTTQDVRVDAKKVKDSRRIVGLMDVLSLPKMETYYRVLISSKGNLELVKIDEKEANLKPCVVAGKTIVKGKVQLNLSDGRNLLVDKDIYKVGDTIVIELPGQLVKEHVKLEKGCMVYLTGGKHVGSVGVVENIQSNKITFKLKKAGSYETAKKYGFVIGKTKPVISVAEKILKPKAKK